MKKRSGVLKIIIYVLVGIVVGFFLAFLYFKYSSDVGLAPSSHFNSLLGCVGICNAEYKTCNSARLGAEHCRSFRTDCLDGCWVDYVEYEQYCDGSSCEGGIPNN